MKLFILIAYLFLSNGVFCASIDRDPFFLPTKNKKKTRKQRLKLRGLVKRGKRLCALIECNGVAQVVVIGDLIGRYIVDAIKDSCVTLVAGKKKIVLYF